LLPAYRPKPPLSNPLTPHKTGSGQLTEKQLGAALVNGDWSSFDPNTVRLMISMFETDGSGTIGFEEFCRLWSFLASWRTLFDRFDVDRSGNISLDEFTNALTAFGYRLTPEFVRFLFRQYDKHRSNQLSFDLFGESITIPGPGY
jgi:peflin